MAQAAPPTVNRLGELRSLRVTMVTTSISRAGGGVTPSLRDLSSAVSAHACTIDVVALEDDFSAQDAEWWPSPVSIHTCRIVGPRVFGFAPGMKRQVDGLKPDILHRHGVWNYPSWVVRRCAASHRIPYVVSVHGMLNRPALQVSKVRKRIFGALAERRFLNNAGCIHALTAAEATACRRFGLTNPIAVIPNGIHTSDSTAAAGSPPWPAPHDGRKVLLFLGRLNPIKGLPLLLESFAMVNDRNWRLVIAGWDQQGHRDELEALVADLELGTAVDFVGPLYGEEKNAAMSHCDAFVLPSISEAHPVAVLEAWARCVPAVITEACNLPEATRDDLSIVVRSNQESMIAGLRAMFGMEAGIRRDMGRRAQQYTEAHYCWEHQAQKMLSVYNWLRGNGEVPNCVESV